MVDKSRAERLSDTFVKLTDTLVADYDVLDLLHTLVEDAVDILDAAQAGLLLSDANGNLQLLASTSEQSQLVELLQLEAGAGPCVECYRTGTVITVHDIRALGDRWPAFQQIALDMGFKSVHAVPMRVHTRVIGAMGLFGAETGALTPEDASIAQAMADVATISLLQERTIREAGVLNHQLQRALTTRVLIEQAKGVIAQTKNLTMDDAFNVLRAHARSSRQNLHDVAESIVQRSLVI